MNSLHILTPGKPQSHMAQLALFSLLTVFVLALTERERKHHHFGPFASFSGSNRGRQGCPSSGWTRSSIPRDWTIVSNTEPINQPGYKTRAATVRTRDHKRRPLWPAKNQWPLPVPTRNTRNTMPIHPAQILVPDLLE